VNELILCGTRRFVDCDGDYAALGEDVPSGVHVEWLSWRPCRVVQVHRTTMLQRDPTHDRRSLTISKARGGT